MIVGAADAMHPNHNTVMTMAMCRRSTTLPDSVWTLSYLNQSERLSEYLGG